MSEDEQAAIDRLRASQALEELVRRHGWDTNPPCPDCGSYAHFECGGSPGVSITRVYWDGERMATKGIAPSEYYSAEPTDETE